MEKVRFQDPTISTLDAINVVIIELQPRKV